MNAPWDTIDELMDYIKENPGEVRMPINIGTVAHFIGIEMNIAIGGGGDIIVFVSCGGDSA